MKKRNMDEEVEESAATTTSANAGAYTKPLGWSSKSIPFLVKGFVDRVKSAKKDEEDE